MENILSGNPLINLAGQQQQQQMNPTQNTFRVKRRYLTNTRLCTLLDFYSKKDVLSSLSTNDRH